MNYHDIKKDDFLNGDGLRTTVFLSGCEHHCNGCQNPITWDKNNRLPFNEAAKQEIIDSLKNTYTSGVTFSGGDPLATYNRAEVLDFMQELKAMFPEKTIWCYTGYTKEQIQDQDPIFWNKLSKTIDVLVDGKFEIDKLDVKYHWAGSTNQRVLRKEDGFMHNTSLDKEEDPDIPYLPVECECER